MTDLRDSKLTAAQLNVLVELNSTSKLPKGVRPRTIEILREGKYIDVARVGTEDPTYILRTEGKREIGIKEESLEAAEDSIMEDNSGFDFHTNLMNDVAELESALKGDPWKMGEQITADEPYLEFPALNTPEEVKAVAASQGIVLTDEEALKVSQEELGDRAPFADGVERYQEAWTSAEKIEAGFGATLMFRKTEGWDGLTAKEIKEDIKTARPIGRKGERAYQRTARKALKQLVAAL